MEVQVANPRFVVGLRSLNSLVARFHKRFSCLVLIALFPAVTTVAQESTSAPSSPYYVRPASQVTEAQQPTLPVKKPQDENQKDESQESSPSDQKPKEDTKPESQEPKVEQPKTTTPQVPPVAAPQAPFSLFGEFTYTGRDRRAGMPRVFGDFFPNNSFRFQSVEYFNNNLGQDIRANNDANIVLAGGTGYTKIGENNGVMPGSRTFFTYNHFHNAIEYSQVANTLGSPPVTTTTRTSHSIDRYTVGLEKAFYDGLFSFEMRLPMQGVPTIQAAGYGQEMKTLGNASCILKALLIERENFAISGGLGVNAPLAPDTVLQLSQSTVRIHNETVHLIPFLGMAFSHHSYFFHQAFFQVDVPLNDNTIEVTSGTAPISMGQLSTQSLLAFDYSFGAWLHRNPQGPLVRGIAGLFEVHYATTLEDSSSFASGLPNGAFFTDGLLSGVGMVNLTTGLHFELHNDLRLRIGAVTPLGQGANRAFDTEFMVTLVKAL